MMQSLDIASMSSLFPMQPCLCARLSVTVDFLLIQGPPGTPGTAGERGRDGDPVSALWDEQHTHGAHGVLKRSLRNKK